MVKTKLLFILLLLCCSTIGSTVSDSLYKLSSIEKNDSIKIQLLFDSGYEIESSYPDSAIILYRKAYQIADRLNHNLSRGKAYRYMGLVYDTYKRDIDSAIFCFNRSVEFLRKCDSQNCDLQRAYVFNRLGFIYSSKNKTYNKGIDYYKESIAIKKAYNDVPGIAVSYGNIGLVFFTYGDYKSALLYMQKALNASLEIYEIEKGNEQSNSNKQQLILAYQNISITHHQLYNYDSALFFLSKASMIIDSVSDKIALANNFEIKGGIYNALNKYDSALFCFDNASKLFEKLNMIREKGAAYNNIGNTYRSIGDYEKALNNYFEASSIFESINDSSFLPNTLANIGDAHASLGRIDLAFEYLNEAVKIYRATKRIDDVARTLVNLGSLYFFKKQNVDSAEVLYNEAFSLAKSSGNIELIGLCNYKLGNVFMISKDYYKAQINYFNALEIFEQTNNRDEIQTTLANLIGVQKAIGDSCLDNSQKRKHYLKAISYAERALKMAKEDGIFHLQEFEFLQLKEIYIKLGDYENACKYADLYIAAKDSIFSIDKTKALTEMTAKYESEKKELQIDNLNKEKALKVAELAQSEEKRSKQLILIYSFVAGFIIILVFTIIILRLFMQKKKANLLLAQQKKQIEIQNSNLLQANEEISAQRDEISAQRDLVTEQKDHIEEQKKEIEDSIHYAKRIQTAVLPADKYADSILGDHFILFKPHSVVSGDFYWAAKTEEWTIIAVADCTGHGVPGAFMSMLGVSFLNEIVRKKDVTTPAEVLNQLRESIIDALGQTGEPGEQKDGMDMSLLAISNDRKHAMWAGANNPIYLIRNVIASSAKPSATIEQIASPMVRNDVELIEYKGDKMPVAVHERMDSFTNHEIEIREGDRFYLFTDGYPDQFGGPKGKKFMYKAFKNVLLENAGLTMAEQKTLLEKKLSEWMNHDENVYEQVDDITVLGINV